MQKNGWVKERERDSIQFPPFHSWREKSEITSSWISHGNICMDWACGHDCGHGVRLGLSHWHKDKRLQTGFPIEALSLNIEKSYLSRLRCYGERQRARSCFWSRTALENDGVVQNPCGCCWACRKYSQCYRYRIYTLDPKNICFQRVSLQCLCGKVQEVIYCTAGLNWNFWV